MTANASSSSSAPAGASGPTSGPLSEEVERAVRATQLGAAPIGAWLTPLLVPPAIGLGLIFMVMVGAGNSTIVDSPGAASAALAVGALLILGSAALYVLSPKRYDHFFTDLRQRLQAGAAGVDRYLAGASKQSSPERP